MKTVYTIIRDCCTRGNCVRCYDLPFGQTNRIVQMTTPDLKRAEEVATNWYAYDPKIIATEQAKLF